MIQHSVYVAECQKFQSASQTKPCPHTTLTNGMLLRPSAGTSFSLGHPFPEKRRINLVPFQISPKSNNHSFNLKKRKVIGF